ncbi:MAG TPA: autotransporter outer membrane beta-barrel domain-containing protein, partial [Polyangia bacterium]|nr:autotransporter outer membrane beta-barrel domain-containing protein [Polyangia bacterium]
AVDITVGGALMPGLILAGSLNGGFFSEPKLTAKSGSTIDGDGILHNQTLNLFVLSILADFYPHPERGLHFGGAFGFGGSEIQDTKTNRTSALQPGGVAASLHAGYEWWVADDWSIGVMARLTYMHLSDSVVDSAFGTTVKLTQSGVLPTVTASFTFN